MKNILNKKITRIDTVGALLLRGTCYSFLLAVIVFSIFNMNSDDGIIGKIFATYYEKNINPLEPALISFGVFLVINIFITIVLNLFNGNSKKK